jgi:hypothetical protein
MSNQSPTANGRDQQGDESPSAHRRSPRVEDETGFGAGMEDAHDGPPADVDIDRTEDPSKD